jgi:PKD repeat protein
MNKPLAALCGLLLLATPLLASADTASDLQAQIQALLAQVKQLQAQLVQLQGAGQNSDHSNTTPSAPSTPSTPSQLVVCPVLDRVLAFDSQGDDVTQLQQFLSQEGVFDGTATGYFGAQTRAAVQKWQAQQGIVSSGDASSTGFGTVGPATRRWISRHCSVGGDQNFSASPTSGAAPLAVTFRITTSGGNYYLDFGDDQTTMVNAPAAECAAGPCNAQQTVAHTYTGNGTYTAKLQYQEPCNPPPGAACTQVLRLKTVGTVTIYVGATSTALPIINAALAVETQYLNVETQIGSICNVSTSANVAASNAAIAKLNGLITTLNSGGDQTVVLQQLDTLAAQHALHTQTDLSAAQQVLNSCSGNSSNGAPSVSGVSGPASLNVGAQGTWTVKASVPSSGDQNLSYSVTWGDESVYDRLGMLASSASVATQASATFTHTYGTAGTFHPTFTVSNSAGSAHASASVVVGSTSDKCPVYNIPLCSPGATLVGQGNDASGCPLPSQCVPGTTSGTFSASPTSGSSPLLVVFSGVGTSIDFGDGGAPVTVGDRTKTLGIVTHVYTGGGTYTASSNGATVQIAVNTIGGGQARVGTCAYNGTTYAAGQTMSLTGNGCLGARAQSDTCVTPSSLSYTCTAGQWVDDSGTILGSGASAASCTTPWGSVTVQNGQTVSSQPYFSNGSYSASVVVPVMRCSNGTWLKCDWTGNSCTLNTPAYLQGAGVGTTGSASDSNANLANALSGLGQTLAGLAQILNGR